MHAKKLRQWLQTTPYHHYTLTIASADASFRQYYRLTHNGHTLIVMDASLEKEALKPFIDITQRLQKVGVHVAKIFATNLEEGYLILEDFGSCHLLDLLNKETFHTYYTQAIDIIITMQHADTTNLPLYDAHFLHQEMALMPTWYLNRHCNYQCTPQQEQMLLQVFHDIATTVLQQPQGYFVHRDFHARNIMLTPEKDLGIIDYQDAMSGALCYDLVSLLKDCYIAFDPHAIEQLALTFRDKTYPNIDDETFIRWFDFMGLQRHIKVLGIFARLWIRDKKDGYLKDIPLVRNYVIQTAKKYPQTQPLAIFLEQYTP